MGEETTKGTKEKWTPQRVTADDAAHGRVLAAAREQAGMKVRDAAEASGIDRSVITRIELGQRPVRVTELDALAQSYGIGTESLMQRLVEATRDDSGAAAAE